MAKGSLPVIVGVGQTVSHWKASDGLDSAPSPLSLSHEASMRALADTGVDQIAKSIDAIAMTRTFQDSWNGAPKPFGAIENLPGLVADAIGATPDLLIYEIAGGQSPQALVNELSARIHAGDVEAALITGSEATGTVKAATRAGIELDWRASSSRPVDDRGFGSPMVNRTEAKHGAITAHTLYALFETAIAAREGRTREAHRKVMSDIFAPFSEVASKNPYSQFPTPHSSQWLATPSRDNREMSDPFLKWHVAQDAVNLGAALILMSDDKADALGIAPEKRIYIHGAGEAGDTYISERASMDRSWAMDTALNRALTQAGIGQGDISFFDLYSCFPCAVSCAAFALGIDPVEDPRGLTLTGGLPFFGGPGNNYSMHGIAAMVETLRGAPGDLGLVLANGGWLTKEAAAIYSSKAPATFTPAEARADAPVTITIDPAPTRGVLETYTVVHGFDGPQKAVAFCRTETGARFLANGGPDLVTALRSNTNQVGRSVSAHSKGERNFITLD